MASSEAPTSQAPASTDNPVPSLQSTAAPADTSMAEAEDLPPSYESQLAPGNGSTALSTAPFRAENYAKDGKKHILLCATGSVAAIKLPDIIQQLSSATDLAIRIVLTQAATHFFSGVSAENPPLDSLRHLPHVEALYTDADEWTVPWQRGNAILHIELRKWTDILIVAPLDANTLAKMTNGMADNLLLSVLRAWEPEGISNPAGRQRRPKYLVVAPAMNTAMWLHPVTKKQIKILEEEWSEAREFERDPVEAARAGSSRHSIRVVPWARVLKPVEKDLACGDRGYGAMVHVADIVREILHLAKKYR